MKMLSICAVQYGSQVVQRVKNLPAREEIQVQSLGREDPLEKGTNIHSNILAWRIPWTEEPGGLQSMGSQRVGHNWATEYSTQQQPSPLAWHWKHFMIQSQFTLSVSFPIILPIWFPHKQAKLCILNLYAFFQLFATLKHPIIHHLLNTFLFRFQDLN